MSDAAAIIRQARTDAGLTQGQLAERVGTKQPNIARLEAGGREPSPAALANILAACGVGPIHAAVTGALATYPGATVVRVRAPRSVVLAAREELGLPERLPRGRALPLPYPHHVRVDATVERVEVDLAITWSG